MIYTLRISKGKHWWFFGKYRTEDDARRAAHELPYDHTHSFRIIPVQREWRDEWSYAQRM